MSQLVALAVSIGLLGGIATFIYLQAGLLIWAGFIAWACFFHSGGDTNALKQTIIGNAFGAIVALIAALILVNLPAITPVSAAIVVAITVFVLVAAAHVKLLSNIPAGVYGYAATFAYLLMTAEALALAPLMAFGMGHPLVKVILSMAVGALFGLASARLAGMLTKKA